jgi:hypothetical protein
LNFQCCDTTVSWQDTHSQSDNGIQTEVDKKIMQTLKTIRILYFAPAFFGVGQMHYGPPKEILGGPWPTQKGTGHYSDSRYSDSRYSDNHYSDSRYSDTRLTSPHI